MNTTPTVEETTSDDGTNTYTDAMIYGYGTAAVAIISLFSLLGIMLFPTLNRKSYKLTLQCVIGLGIGTMTADALIHIIPTVLGLHDEGHDHDHDHGEEDEHSEAVWKMSVVFGGLYLFYFFENGLKTWKRCRVENTETAQSTEESNGSQERVDIVCLGLTTTTLTVFVGDALHNLADGMAIGISFASSLPTGLGTSLAILCHEIPHEFGDFAIYLNNGSSKWRAIGLNLIAACCAFVGLYIGIALGNNEAARSWLLAVIAGMFLYIALVQVTSEMVREETSKPILQFALQNFGLLLGWAMMLLMGLYEEQIQESITG